MNYQNTAYTVYKDESISKDEWYSKNQTTFQSMSDVIFKDFKAFSKIILNNFVTYYRKDIFRFFPKLLGVLIAIGTLMFIITLKNKNILQKYFLLANSIFYLQILLIFYSERFSLPLLTFYCFLLVSLFSYDFLRNLNVKILKIKIFGIIIFMLAILNFYNSYIIAKEEINSGPTEILTIKAWVEKNLDSELVGKKIMARKPHIAYYLDMNFFVTPFVSNYDDFKKTIKDNDIDYCFVSEKEGSFFSNENLKQNLLKVEVPPPELEVIFNTTNPTTILFKVKK